MYDVKVILARAERFLRSLKFPTVASDFTDDTGPSRCELRTYPYQPNRSINENQSSNRFSLQTFKGTDYSLSAQFQE